MIYALKIAFQSGRLDSGDMIIKLINIQQEGYETQTKYLNKIVNCFKLVTCGSLEAWSSVPQIEACGIIMIMAAGVGLVDQGSL